MNKVVFADGSEIIDGSISISAEKQIMISLPGETLVSAVTILTDTSKTSEMICYYSAFKRTYTGFTFLSSIGTDGRDNIVRGYLTGVDPSVKEEYTVPEEYLPESMRHKKEAEVDANDTAAETA